MYKYKKNEMNTFNLMNILKSEIKKEYRFVNDFSKKVNISRFTLSRCFNHHQDMQLRTFLKIMIKLKKLRSGSNILHMKKHKEDYKMMDILNLYNNRKELEKVFNAIDELKGV